MPDDDDDVMPSDTEVQAEDPPGEHTVGAEAARESLEEERPGG